MIKIFRTLQDFETFHNENNKTIGFVPTMGNLHQGHISLLERSLQENEISFLSIFVNPTQFGEGEDLEDYPRTFEADKKKTEELLQKYPGKEVIIFFPENDKVIYPEGPKSDIKIEGLNSILEGELRPTHFDGVTTVVKRLFEIVLPNNAYFGKKDYQQLAMIKILAQRYDMPLKVNGLPIVREPSGLAMSSRNGYLSTEQKEQALTLYRSLNKIKDSLISSGIEEAKAVLEKSLESDQNFNYLSIRDAKTLENVKYFDRDLVILGNYQQGSTRLLDNLEISKEQA